jgi:hypothetical protein
MIVHSNPLEFTGIQKELTKNLIKYDKVISNIHEHKGTITIYGRIGSIKVTIDILCCSPDGNYDLEMTIYDSKVTIEDYKISKTNLNKLLVIRNISLKSALKILSNMSRY